MGPHGLSGRFGRSLTKAWRAKLWNNLHKHIRSRMDLKSKPSMNGEPRKVPFSPVRIIASNILNFFLFAEMNL